MRENLYGEKLTQTFFKSPTNNGICGFIHTLWSCKKPNMVSFSQAFRQIPTCLVEKPDETLGLCLVVIFFKINLSVFCFLKYIYIYIKCLKVAFYLY